jgi:branched-chain amino acid transport system permease protein
LHVFKYHRKGKEKKKSVTQFVQLFILGLAEGTIYAMVGAAIVLVFKATKVASLAHGQLLAFGALFFYMFSEYLRLPLIIAFVSALALSGIIGQLIERIILRPLIGQPLFATFLATFAIFMLFDGAFNVILKGTSLPFPAFLPKGSMHFGSVTLPKGELINLVVTIVLFASLRLLFQHTKIGLGMRATAEGHQLAQSVGVGVKKIFSRVWILSAVVAAIGGLAVANVSDIFITLPSFGMKGLIVALFGGLDSFPGVLLGGIILGILENVSAGYLDPLVGGGVKEVAAYAMLLLILLVRPNGLFGEIEIERI